MPLRICIIIIIFLTSSILFGKDKYEDSVLFILKSESIDSLRVNHWIDLAGNFSRSNSKKYYEYSILAFRASLKADFKEGIILSAYNIGRYHRNKANYDSALHYFETALNHAGDHHQKLSNINYNMGNVHKANGGLTQAIEHYIEALAIAESNHSQKDIAIAHLGLGNIYLLQLNTEKSLEYFLNSNIAFKEINDTRGEYISSNNIGTCYYKIRKYADAKKYFLNAKQLAIQIGDTKGLANIYGNLGGIFNQEEKPDSALLFAHRALKIRKKFDSKQEIVISYHSLAEINIALAQFNTAETYLDSALIICNEIESIKELKFNWNYRAMLDSTKGDFKSAFNALQKYQYYKSEVEEKETKSNIEVLQSKYETQKKEAEIVTLSQRSEIQKLEIQQKNQGILIGLTLFGFIMSGAYFIYRQRISKSQKSQIEIEQRFLRSQLNPHFIFNALLAIQNFVLKNDAKTAAMYLTKFAKLMREILENSRHEFISVDNEMKMLSNYLDIHQLRMDNSFEYTIEIDDNIDSEIDTIPPMFVQPFVENAIEHGVIHAKDNGEIVVKFTKEDEYISIEVRDNGKGTASTKSKNKNHQSLASTIIQERMNLFNKSLKNKIKLVIDDIKNEKNNVLGTRVELKVPFS